MKTLKLAFNMANSQTCQMLKATRRQLLLSAEMIFSLLFLTLGYFALHLPLRILECSMNHGKSEGLSRLPGITECLKWWLPEHGVSGVLGTIALAFGFASVASATQEPFSSRLFRWFLIPLGLAFFAAMIPIAESHTCLCSGIDDNSWMDEILFLIGCLSLGFAGWRYACQQKQETDVPELSSGFK
jgi:hypothetical protein